MDVGRAARRARHAFGFGPSPGPAQPDGQPKGRGRRYSALWNPPTETDALLQIFNTASAESFDEGGRWDFERISQYFDGDSAVLDLGCGIGRVAAHVAPNCRRLWAVDVSQRMLHLARERMADLDNVTYTVCDDVTFSEVPTGSVDFAYSLLVLQHVEREDAFLLLEELRRVLKPTGTMYLTYPNLLSDTYLECFVTYAHSGVSAERARARLYTPQEVERILPAAGFAAEVTAETEIRVVARPTPA